MFETRAPAAKFTTAGDQVTGRIVDVRRVQKIDYTTKIPLYWQDKQPVKNAVNPLTGLPNDPLLQTEITLDTGVPDENGITERRVFVRGRRMTDALKTAVIGGGGGRDGLLIGGTLACALIGTEPSAGGGSDAKVYRFAYSPPAAGEGRKPDPTPHLAGGAWNQQPPTTPAAPQAAPLPDFHLQQQQQRPIVAPYATTATVAAPFTDEPPF